jgi:uncharacterized protein
LVPRTAVAVMARAPSAPGKTRLAAHLAESRLRDLRRALLADTLLVVRAVPDADPWIVFTPDDARREIDALGREALTSHAPHPDVAPRADRAFELLAQRGNDLGDRMHAVFQDLLIERAYGSVVLVGSDIALLDARVVTAAVGTLGGRDRIVIGPADDGGYYLIGLSAPAPELFTGVGLGGPDVLRDTLAAARRIDRDVRLMSSAYDVDTVDDLERLERDLSTAPLEVAPNVRAWLAASGRS